ncbi:MAG: phosphatidate cytidylyltransferase, partial [Alphaproteobacteria bacterium]|nr:phosphatidate cytidylyltransferase [Alphaproteobacteria bacterium]
MAKIELNSLQKRILTSLVMIPIAIGALRSGHPYVDILIFAVGALLSWEWSNMVPSKNQTTYAICYTFALGCSLLVFNRIVLFSIISVVTLFLY